MTKISNKSVVKVAITFLITLFILCMSGFALTTANAQDATVTDVKITINFSPYEEKFPNGVKGKEYRVFDATAVDNLGNELVVDYIVTNPENKVVLVADGKFATDTIGKYVITYKASSGVVEDVEKVTINVVDSCDALSYTFNSKLNDTATTGEIYYLYDGISAGGSGNIETTMSLSLDGEEVSYFENDSFKYFKPIKGGEYLLSFTLKDFVGNIKTFDKTITVVDSDLPIMTNPSFALVNKVGDVVKLPLVDAVLYVDGQSFYVPVKVYYDDTDITNTMSYTATSVGEHVIRYEAENVLNNNYKAVKSYNVPTYAQSEELYIENYFALDNFVGTYPEDASGYILTTESDNAGFQFKSKIYEEFLNLSISLENESLTFDSFDIVFTDSMKGDDKVTLTFVNEKTMKVYNNGKVRYEDENTLLKIFRDAIYVKYNYANDAILDTNNKEMFKITNFDDGRTFTGFASGYVYLSCKINGVTEKTAICVKNIAATVIASGTADVRKPMFCTTDDFSGSLSANLGQTVRLAAPKAFDLLNDDKVTYSIQISHGKDKPITIQGAVYDLYIADTGSYSIRFFANDSCGNEQRATMTIHVEDRTAPSLIVKEFNINDVKVGDTITLPEPEIADNLTVNEKLISFIYVSFGAFYKDTVYDFTYTFKQAGKYEFTYAVWDEAGNRTTIKYVVNCTEAK